jgi:beta-lactam-binding protein with PASTA domain
VILAALAGAGAWAAGYLADLLPWGSSAEGPAAPDLSVAEVHSILEDPALRTDPEIAPWLGISVESEDGTLYHYDGSSWSAITPGGDRWGLPGSTARIIETSSRVAVSEVREEGTAWAHQVLEDTPGLSREGEEYRVTDYVIYRDGLIQAASDHGVLVTERDESVITVTRPQAIPYVWMEPAEDHAWIIDETAAVLVVEAGEDLTVAGRLVMDGLHGAVWEPAPGADRLSGVIDKIFDGIQGAEEREGRREIPFKIFVPGEAPPIREDKVVIQAGGSARVGVRKYEPPEQECSWWKCAIDAVGGAAQATGSGVASGLERGWSGVANSTGQALEAVDLGTMDCVMVGMICQLRTAESLARGTAGVVEAVWEVRGNIFAEKDCGSPGPGSGPDGDPADHAYPVETNGYSLQGVRTPFTQDWQDRLDLARLWMPLMELSQEEQCGEILRVFAKVHTYGPDGEEVSSLNRAARVEIVYTLFFKHDGGRFQILGLDHPGDNEGFVIGLARTEQGAGRCTSGFEFVAGRSVGHSETGGKIVAYLQANARQIDDFDRGDVGTGCPESRDPEFRLLVAEAKHATYYHRQVCEAALVPNLPALAGGFIAGGLPGALTGDALMKLAPDAVAKNLQDGLEECESGRPLLDLSPRVELFAEELRSAHGEALNYYDTYATEEGPKTFEEAARGRWCFGPQASALPRYPSCGYDYHVPGFFDYPAAQIGTTVPPLVNLSEEQARAAVEAEGLALEVTSTLVDHPNGAGRVLSQDPEAGTVVPPGSRIAVRVGIYEQVEVPDLVGMTSDQARSALEAAGLVYAHGGEVEVSDEDADLHGLVVEQDPTAGSELDPGGRVHVYIGSYAGSVMALVPDTVGLTAAAARQATEAAGLRYTYGGEVGITDPELDGLVAAQDYSPGTELPEGTTVTIYVGAYEPAAVDVPDLGGLIESDARRRVEDLGLVFKVAGTMPTSDSLQGRVVDQDPISGSVLVGSTIRVWIGDADGSGEETSISFPEQRTSFWVSVSITGGHGSVHHIGEVVDLCWSWAQLSGEPPGQWQLWDFQPPESEGVMQDSGTMLSAGSDCISATITGPVGYEEIVAVALQYDHGESSWEVVDWANVWIYVED